MGGVGSPVRDTSKVLECGLLCLGIESEKMNKTLQYFWSHLGDTIEGFRSKTFPASLTGDPWGDRAKS
jgi:hypothetical protein